MGQEKKQVMMELHGEFRSFVWEIFQAKVLTFYLDLLQKSGSTLPHSKEIQVLCWKLVTKLLQFIFVEIHKV